MRKIADLIYLCILIFFIFNLNLLAQLGGSLSFLLVYAFLSYISLTYKRFQTELSILIFISFTLIGINYLAYIEAENVYPYIFVMIGFLISFLIFVTSFIQINTRIIKIKDNEEGVPSKKEKIEIFKIIYGFYSFYPMVFIFYSVFPGFAFGVSPQVEALFRQSTVKYLVFGLFWMIVSYILAFIRLRSINKNYILSLLAEKEKIKIPKIKKYFTIGCIFIFLIGSLLEMVRGLWIIWIETYLLFFCILMASWQIWRYIFEEHVYDSGKVNLEELKSIWDFNYFIKYGSIYTLVFIVYAIVLILVLG